MRKVIVLILAIYSLSSSVRADEGMWLLPLIEKLNMMEMQELGFQLSAEDIYNVNNSSLKDAIVIFGGGCTGEMVSEDGLLFTNHHCGYDQIQNHSTVEHDYLQDGFWAMNREEELPNPELEVKFLRSIENVTAKILDEFAPGMTEKERRKALKDKVDEMEEHASHEGEYKAYVKTFFAGNEYYLFVYEVFKDVRFVGAPPSSIGKFGFDTDNWVWPRHTGDFSIFRVYSAPDGSPAEYSPDNVPYKPDYFLPVSLDGVKKDDFAFVIGYPGSTDRYLSSYGIEETMQVTNDIRIKVRGLRQVILLEDMQADPAVNIMYASKYSRSSNYWKYSIGQNRGLKRLDVIEKKVKEEEEFLTWAADDSSRDSIYGSILREMKSIYEAKSASEYNSQYLDEAFFRASELIDFISEFQYLYLLMLVDDEEKDSLTEDIDELRDVTEKFFSEYNMPTDRKVIAAMLALYSSQVPAAQHPDIYNVLNKKYKGDYEKFTNVLFDKSLFTSKDKVLEFLAKPSTSILEKDLGFTTMNSIFMKAYEEESILDEYDLQLIRLNRLYLKGRMEKEANDVRYPDANFTMRLSYGNVDDYSPADAVEYDYITFLSGVMEKEDENNFEFVVPEKLKELYTTKDYGRYGMEDRMPVCFITNHDITGGNSGSPVLNGEGELIGLAFDGNWEAMSGDIAFEEELQRCICVDIRYVLFIIEKFAGAGHLIEELKIAN